MCDMSEEEFDEYEGVEEMEPREKPQEKTEENPKKLWRQFKTKLRLHLDSIRAAGEIASYGRFKSFVNPGLEILGHLPISLPLRPQDAEAIRDACRQAPFGRGDETVVDTSVRKTWELDHTQFRLCNPSWNGFVQHTLLAQAAKNLGLEKARAEPYKMLLYEAGSFFKRHKDSEKTPGMVATLVVCLPSEHEGGEVHLSFGGIERTLETGPVSKFDMTALAWYADVAHEVKELTSGYRLVLTYNITMDSPGLTSASNFIEQSNVLRGLLKKWVQNFPKNRKACYSTDHQYSKSSLSRSLLKGRDAVVFKALQIVAAEEGFYLFLAHLSHSKVDDEGDYYDEDGEEPTTSLTNIFTPKGALAAAEASISTKELMNEHLFENRAPDSEDEGEFTGNESMPSTLRYHNTVIILMPKAEVLGLIGTSGVDAVLSMVMDDLALHSHDPLVKATAVKILKASISTTHRSMKQRYGNITQCALVLGEHGLYREMTSVWRREPDVLRVIANAVERKCQHPQPWTEAEKAAFPEWGHWVDGMLSPSSRLEDLTAPISAFEKALSDPHLRDSFKKWAKGTLLQRMEATTVWNPPDLHPLQALMLDKQEDPDWLVTWLLPNLSRRGSRELLAPFLLTASEPRTGTSYDPLVIFEYVLENAADKLRLQPKDVSPDRFGRYAGFTTWHNSAPLPYGHQAAFLDLLDRSLRLGVFSSFLRVIDRSRLSLEVLPSGVEIEAATMTLLAEISTKLQEHHIDPSPVLTSFFKSLLEKFLSNANLPSYPVHRGWSYEPQGCKPPCPDCVALNEFLQSSTQKEWRLPVGAQRRKHIESQLYGMDMLSKNTEKTARCHTLCVTKRMKSFTYFLNLYKMAMGDVERRVAPLKGEYMEKLLGPEDYRSLVLLESVQGGAQPTPVPADVAMEPSAGNAGTAVHQSGLQTGNVHAYPGPSRAYLGPGTANAQPEPLAPNVAAGQKRPADTEDAEDDGRQKRVVIVLD